MLTRSTLLLGSLVTLVPLAAACGDDGATPVDAPPSIGFDKPKGALKANNQVGDQFMEVGPADLGCMGTPDIAATTVDVALTTTIRDFQNDTLVPGATVTVFPEAKSTMPFAGGPYTSDGTTAMVTPIIPTGTKRFGFKITHSNSMDTLLLNQKVDPNMMAQSLEEVSAVSKSTAQSLPAIIGVSRTPGSGVLAGVLRDCARNEVSNFIATVSTTKSEVTHLAGAVSYYFSASASPLPVRHTQSASSTANGLFMVIEMDATPTAYVQIWGYKTDADLAADNLSLIAELETAVIGDTVITGSYEPLRTP